MECPADFWTVLPDYLLALAAMLTFFFGLHQFRRSQRWKRNEFLATTLKEMQQKQTFANACRMLDWDERHYTITDDEGREFTALITKEEISRVFDLLLPSPNNQELLTEEEKKSSSKKGRHQILYTRRFIIDQFDSLFDGLSMLGHYLETGLVDREPLNHYFEYYYQYLDIEGLRRQRADMVRHDREAMSREQSKRVCWHYRMSIRMNNYIDKYKYSGIPILLRAYENRHAPHPMNLESFFRLKSWLR